MITLVWEADIHEWVAATPPADWYGKCAGLTDRVVAVFTGAGRQWYDSATDARRASGALNPDPSTCPPGGIHFWSYYGTAWDGSRGDWGHVTIDIRGGGTATLSATGHAFEYWGVNAGLISVESQSARAGMRYLGWARTFGAASPLTITTESTAGGDAHPLTPAADVAEGRKLTMTEALIVEATSNNLVIVNVKDRTLINLGNDPDDQLRAWFADNYPHKFMSSEEWTAKFGPGTGYNYVGHGTRAS